MKMKRRYEDESYIEIEQLIKSNEYTVKVPADRKKYKSEDTWKVMRLIYDADHEMLPDYFYCSCCGKVFHLKLSNNSKTLKNHALKCSGPASTPVITDHFLMQPPPNKKLKLSDRAIVKNAAMEFIIRDVRPVSSICGDGLRQLASCMTYIGAAYGHLTPEMIGKMNILPSRPTVSVCYRCRDGFVVSMAHSYSNMNSFQIVCAGDYTHRKMFRIGSIGGESRHFKRISKVWWCDLHGWMEG